MAFLMTRHVMTFIHVFFSVTLINELKYIVSLNFNEFKTHLIDKNQFNEKYLIILKNIFAFFWMKKQWPMKEERGKRV